MAARSHSMSSAHVSGELSRRCLCRARTLVEITLVEVVRARDVHVVQTCYLGIAQYAGTRGGAGAGLSYVAVACVVD